MPGLEIDGLKELDKDLKKLLEDMPDLRRELHEELGEEAKRTVDAQIDGTKMEGDLEPIRKWQVKHVGSGGGYAAVRAAGEREGGGTGPNSAGAITNYLENGHKTRNPRSGKGCRRRIKVDYVNGFHFYARTKTAMEIKTIRLGEKLMEDIARRLEGGG